MRIGDEEFQLLTAYIKSNYGIDLSNKRILVEGRLVNEISQRGFRDFKDYLKKVFSDVTGKEAVNLINRLSTNHTFFMREEKHFDFFKTSVLPELEMKIGDKDLRIWSAGCSTGEEPYTMAMHIDDYFGNKKHIWDTKILATDISEKALDIAERGIYSRESMKGLPYIWKNKYFSNIDDKNCKIHDKIRQEVIFRKFNLMESKFPFKKKFHVIFCRNVMIYFDSKTKKQLIDKFYEYTEPGGYLFIGHSESIKREETSYKYVIPAVYRKGNVI